MAGAEGEQTASGREGGNVLRRNSDDVGWEYGVLVDPNNKDKVKCILCDKQMFGGVYRLKQHIAQEGKNAKKCPGTKTTKEKLLEAQAKCKKALDEAKRKREEKTVRDLELREEVHSRVGVSEEVTCVGSSEPHKLGPMDKWTKAIDPTATKSESLAQQRLNKELWKERQHEVHKYIARWAFNHAISFNACDNDDFKQMCEAIGQFGPGLEPPTMFDLRGSLLQEEYARCVQQMCEAISFNACDSYADPSIFDAPKLTEAFISCVETFFYNDEDMQEQAANIELLKFQNREGAFSKKLAKTFENFDYNPASWWRLYGTATPALQKMATKILSLTASSSGCERTWSGFDGMHTKKRNRLTVDRLDKLVYIQFNNRLINKRAKIKSKKITDVLLSNDSTEAQGFLQENGDECSLVVFRDEEDEEEVMEGTGIPWSVLGDAVGAEEELELRRSARVRELNEEEFESEEEEFDEDEDEYMMDDPEPY